MGMLEHGTDTTTVLTPTTTVLTPPTTTPVPSCPTPTELLPPPRPPRSLPLNRLNSPPTVLLPLLTLPLPTPLDTPMDTPPDSLPTPTVPLSLLSPKTSSTPVPNTWPPTPLKRTI